MLILGYNYGLYSSLEIWISLRCYLFDLFETGEFGTLLKGSRENTADGLDIVIIYNHLLF